MKNIIKLFEITALVAVMGLSFAACSGAGAGSDLPALTGTVSITAENGLTTGSELTAVYTGTEAIRYQWNKDGSAIPAAVGNKYVPPVPGSYTVTVSAEGYSSKTSAAVTITGVTLPALTGTVTITGNAEVGQTLTANTGSLDGSGTISYQWKRGTANIGTNSAYTVQAADIGSTITVTVTRSGYSGSVTSSPTGTVTAEAPPTQGLFFTLKSNGTYSVSRGLATANEVVIPSFYNETPVTEIPDDGFSGYTNMTSIRIPSSVTSIGGDAFSGCTGLTSITIPFVGASLYGNSNTHFGYIFDASEKDPSYHNSSIPPSLKTVVITGGTRIREYAFSGCSGLTSITIPSSVTSIDYSAFFGCTGLTSVTIPNSVTIIGEAAFSGCTGLTSVTIPDSVTIIGEAAFSGCTGLTGALTIPNGVESIGSYAFFWCTGLTSITIPNGVESIGSYAFSGCTGLTGALTIPDSVTSIGGSAFSGCTGLTSIIVDNNNPSYASQDGILYNKEKTQIIMAPQGISGSITIPNSVTSIGRSAFSGCSGLTSVTIPDSVTIIGEAAFSSCTGLTSITIPDSVIGRSAFYGCSGLTSITIPFVGGFYYYDNYYGGYYEYYPHFGYIFGASNSNNQNSYIPPSLKTVVITGETSIVEYAFSGCSGLTSITIPSSVTSIEGRAFYGCSGLTSVTFQGTITSGDFSSGTFPGDLRTKYFAEGGGIGTYTRPDGTSETWTKQEE